LEAPRWGRPVKCKAIDVLNDLVIDFEGFSLRIPTSAYINRGKGFTSDYDIQELAAEEGCFLALLPEDAAGHQIVLGQPFFKAYDVVFDAGTKSIGFSQRLVPDLDRPTRNYMPYILGTVGLACFVLLGFFLSGAAKSWSKPYVEFSGEGRRLDGSPSSPAPPENLPYQLQVGEPVQILPYQTGTHNYVNVQSDEKIEEN